MRTATATPAPDREGRGWRCREGDEQGAGYVEHSAGVIRFRPSERSYVEMSQWCRDWLVGKIVAEFGPVILLR